jgi:general secretion pathway protein K
LNEQNGFILIAVLWISLLLSIFALNMSTKSRLSAVQAMNVQDMAFQNQALYSGLARGYHEYRKYLLNRGLLDNRDEWESFAGTELDLWFPRYEPYLAELDEQSVGIQILGLNGKLDINNVPLNIMMEIIELCGASPGLEATSIANSILDWIDEDDLKRPEGAEKDYYLSLPGPYLPKNNKVQDIRELLLVQGVTRDIFYGKDEHPGLAHFFSAAGHPEKMDINSASPETFAILGDLPGEIIQDIIDKRSHQPVTRISELGEIIPHGFFDQLQRYYDVSQSDGIEIRAFIVLDDGTPGKTVVRYFD